MSGQRIDLAELRRKVADAEPRELASLERETGEEVYLWALVPGTRDDESAAHSRWAHLSLGGEWFRTTDELLAWAEALDSEWA